MLLALSAAPALAKPESPVAVNAEVPVAVNAEAPAAVKAEAPAAVKAEVPAAVKAVLAVCPGQTFSQPFEALGDSNYYTLVPGSEFNSASEGWELYGGAQISETTRPDGSTGNVLSLPAGAAAVSPPVCVTLQYPTARIWTRPVEGKENVSVLVAYTGTKSAAKPKNVGSIQQVKGAEGEAWTLSEAFNVQPQLGGKTEETREVRFIFAGSGKGSTELFGLYVDPRMI